MQGKSGVYAITNKVNGKQYIGSSYNLQQRWTTHLRKLRNNRHSNKHLQSAYNRYGPDAFIRDVLEYVEDISLLIGREQYYLDMLSPKYNISPTAGSCRGVKHSLETCLKLGRKPLCSAFKTALSEYRLHLQWTRRKLAMEASISPNGVKKAEDGVPIQAKTAKAIADALSRAYGQTIRPSDIEGLTIM